MRKRTQAQDLGLGALPMGGAPMGGAEQAPAPPAYQVIHSPLDGLGKILADLDIKSYLQNHFGTDPETIAHDIWVMYGGSEDERHRGKPGKRNEKPLAEDKQDDEYNNTRNKLWERLPMGVSIEQITSPEEILNAVVGGFHQLIKGNSQPQQASVTVDRLVKQANKSDQRNLYGLADKIDSILIDVYSSK